MGWSSSVNQWLIAKITKVNADGSYDLNCKKKVPGDKIYPLGQKGRPADLDQKADGASEKEHTKEKAKDKDDKKEKAKDKDREKEEKKEKKDKKKKKDKEDKKEKKEKAEDNEPKRSSKKG